jgi:DNA polymerase
MFKVDEITWLDSEVYGGALDLKAAGTFRYAAAASTRVIIWAYALGSAPARTWHADGKILDWDQAPDDLRAAFERDKTFAMWNASFDAAIWNHSMLGSPYLAAERVIDVMVQAGVSNLPTDLEHASRYLGGAGKQKDGKALIRMFCIEGANPLEHPAEWERFLAYARKDVEEMREVYRKTRPLPLEEWKQYWAFEHINRRGNAAALVAQDAVAIGRRLIELTDGAVKRVTQAGKLATWLHNNLADAAMREILMVGIPADDDDGDDAETENPQELSLTRDRVARVLAMLDAKHVNGGLSPNEMKAREAATLRLFGAGAAPKKFTRLDAQQVDGTLRGQYRFAGAYQTGRMTSRGAQIQNLTRDVLGEDGAAERPLVEAIKGGCNYAALVAASPVEVPATRKLALIVRPALVARPGLLFVWSDWSAIEARITPWLANSPGAEAVLDVFRANDRDPTRPDSYVIAATDVFHKDVYTITKPERQIGKVVVLSCGFGGSVGALTAMALSYRIHLDPAEARRIVDAWRAANPWA